MQLYLDVIDRDSNIQDDALVDSWVIDLPTLPSVGSPTENLHYPGMFRVAKIRLSFEIKCLGFYTGNCVPICWTQDHIFHSECHEDEICEEGSNGVSTCVPITSTSVATTTTTSATVATTTTSTTTHAVATSTDTRTNNTRNSGKISNRTVIVVAGGVIGSVLLLTAIILIFIVLTLLFGRCRANTDSPNGTMEST